jgi:hypothetical protein
VSEPLGAEELRGFAAFFEGRPERILAVAAPFQRAQREIVSRVQGSSMGSTLPDGAAVLIRLTDRADHQPGEILAFLLGTRVVVHRLLRRAGRRRAVLITAGDARTCPDPPLRVESVLGRVVGVRGDGAWSPPPPPGSRPVPARLARWFLTRTFALLSLSGADFAARAARILYRLLFVRAEPLTFAGAPR